MSVAETLNIMRCLVPSDGAVKNNDILRESSRRPFPSCIIDLVLFGIVNRKPGFDLLLNVFHRWSEFRRFCYTVYDLRLFLLLFKNDNNNYKKLTE